MAARFATRKLPLGDPISVPLTTSAVLVTRLFFLCTPGLLKETLDQKSHQCRAIHAVLPRQPSQPNHVVGIKPNGPDDPFWFILYGLNL